MNVYFFKSPLKFKQSVHQVEKKWNCSRLDVGVVIEYANKLNAKINNACNDMPTCSC